MQKSNANLLWLHCLANRVALSKFSFILSTGDRTIIPFLLQNAMHSLHFLHKNNKNKKQAHISFHSLPFAMDLFSMFKHKRLTAATFQSTTPLKQKNSGCKRNFAAGANVFGCLFFQEDFVVAAKTNVTSGISPPTPAGPAPNEPTSDWPRQFPA